MNSSSETISVPNYTEPIHIILHNEHHNGAFTTEIKLPFKIVGINRFYATNGYAFISNDNNSLFICDHTTALRYSLKDKSISCCQHKYGKLTSEIDVDNKWIYLKIKSTFGDPEKTTRISLNDFRNGFGPVSNGAFPSALISELGFILQNQV